MKTLIHMVKNAYQRILQLKIKHKVGVKSLLHEVNSTILSKQRHDPIAKKTATVLDPTLRCK